MNNLIKLGSAKTTEKTKRLENALKRNILRRKEQSVQRKQAEIQLTLNERGSDDGNVR